MNKKIILFLLTFVLFLPLLSCGGSDDEPSATDNEKTQVESLLSKLKTNLIGTWAISKHYVTSTSNPYVKIGWNDATQYTNWTYTFKNDGTVIVTQGTSISDNYTYSLSVESQSSRYFSSTWSSIYPYKKYMVCLTLTSKSGGKLEYALDNPSSGDLYLLGLGGLSSLGYIYQKK